MSSTPISRVLTQTGSTPVSRVLSLIYTLDQALNLQSVLCVFQPDSNFGLQNRLKVEPDLIMIYHGLSFCYPPLFCRNYNSLINSYSPRSFLWVVPGYSRRSKMKFPIIHPLLNVTSVDIVSRAGLCPPSFLSPVVHSLAQFPVFPQAYHLMSLFSFLVVLSSLFLEKPTLYTPSRKWQ